MNTNQHTRRHFLRASGITLGLPWLEAFAGAAPSQTPPKRFCAIYFPYGVSLPGEQHEHAKWNWFPSQTGRDFQFSESLKHLAPLRDQVSILGGLHHPHMAGGGGHDSGDTFLTGAALRNGNLKNSISLDQVMAKQLGGDTRFSSLVLSTDGGVGIPTRSNTLSYSEDGQPIPSLNRPAFIFERLFGLNKDSIEAQRKGFAVTGSHLDLLLDEARALNAKLGKADQEKLDQYLTSVRQVEQQVQRSADWLDVPKPQVNASGLTLDADDNTPKELIRTMLDLLVLAFQTDATRVATFSSGTEGQGLPIPELGISQSRHELSHHNGDPGHMEKLTQSDTFAVEQFSYFLTRLAETKDLDGRPLLDTTMALFGSGMAYGHSHGNANLPLVLAGGASCGLKHGSHVDLNQGHFAGYRLDDPREHYRLCGRPANSDAHMSNLLLTMAQKMGVETDRFGDSTRDLELG